LQTYDLKRATDKFRGEHESLAESEFYDVQTEFEAINIVWRAPYAHALSPKFTVRLTEERYFNYHSVQSYGQHRTCGTLIAKLTHKDAKYLKWAVTDCRSKWMKADREIDHVSRSIDGKRWIEEAEKLFAQHMVVKQLGDVTDTTETNSEQDVRTHGETKNSVPVAEDEEMSLSPRDHQPSGTAISYPSHGGPSEDVSMDDTEHTTDKGVTTPQATNTEVPGGGPLKRQLDTNQQDLPAEYEPSFADDEVALCYWDLLHQEEEENGEFDEIIKDRWPTGAGRAVALHMIAMHKVRLEDQRDKAKEAPRLLAKKIEAERRADNLAWRQAHDGEVGGLDWEFEEEAVEKLRQMPPSERTAAIMDEFIDLGDS
jgi:hypothetical protein